MNKKRVNWSLDATLVKKAKIEAINRDITLSKLVEDALRKFLNK